MNGPAIADAIRGALHMDLRTQIIDETSALAERLIAFSDTELKLTQQKASESIGRLQQELSSVREALQAETARVQEFAAGLDAASAHAATLGAQLEAETLRSRTLTAQLEAETNRAATLSSSLEAESLRANAAAAQLETEEERAATLAAELHAGTKHAAELAAELGEEKLRASTLASELETERIRAATLLGAAEAQSAALATELQAETTRAAALAAKLEAETLRAATLASDLDTEKTHAAALVSALENERLRTAALASDYDAERTRAAALVETHASQRQTTIAAETTIRELRELVAQQSASTRAGETRAQAAEAALARMEQELGEARAITDATSDEMSAFTRRVARMIALLNGAATSLVRAADSVTSEDLFAALVREMATEFERVAIFRVKGKHLEGERAAGLDESIDVQKIVIPMSLSSVMTKAARSGTIERAAEKEIGEAHPPFGSSPAAALAAPLVFEGEVLAVVYVESDAKFTDAHAPLAAVLVRYANAVLGGLAQELRTSRHLRDYARTLLQEAETMFDADVESGVPGDERVARLRDSVRFARDLYTQRATLESPLSMDLLDDEIGRMLREPSTAFIATLATALDETAATRDAATA